MKSLIAYVEQHNATCRMFGNAVGVPLDPHNLSGAEMTMLDNKLENDLSPENVSQDGELQGIALRRRVKFLKAARQELVNLSIARARPVSELRELLAA